MQPEQVTPMSVAVTMFAMAVLVAGGLSWALAIAKISLGQPVVASLVALRHFQQSGTRDTSLPQWLFYTLHISVWLAVISTVWSGLEYIVAAARILGKPGR